MKKTIKISMALVMLMALFFSSGPFYLRAAPLDNSTPILLPLDPTVLSGQVNKAMNFNLEGFDFDTVDVLTYSAANLPAGAVLDSTSGGFSWTPALSQLGAHEVTFSVSDGIDSNSLTVTLTVTETAPANNTPFIYEVTPKTVEAGTNLIINLSALDPDNDPLTFSSPNLPTGATLDSTSGIFSWTPEISQAGIHDISFSVSDGKESNTTVAEITVTTAAPTPVNNAPILEAVADQAVSAGNELVINLKATDADNDALTFSSLNLPEGAALDATTGKFNWTPNAGQIGSYNVTFSVSDGEDTDTIDVNLTVTAPEPQPNPTPTPKPHPGHDHDDEHDNDDDEDDDRNDRRRRDDDRRERRNGRGERNYR